MSHRPIVRALPTGLTSGLTSGLKWLLRAVLGSAAVLALVAAFMAARLSQGPIDLAFLEPRLSEALSRSAGGIAATARGFSLQALGGNLAVTASGLEARTAAGGLIARADSALVRFSLARLLRGEVHPTRLTISGGALIAVRGADGVLTLRATQEHDANKSAIDSSSNGTNDESADILALARTWLNADSATEDPPDLDLKQTSLIAMDGQTGAELWRAQLDAAATLTPDVILLRAHLDFDNRPGAAPADISASLVRGEGGSAKITLENADIAILARAMRLLNITLPPIDGRLTGTATVNITKDLRPSAAALSFEAANIEAAFKDGARLNLDHIAVEARADPEAKKVVITRLKLGRDASGLIGAGVIKVLPSSKKAARFVAHGRIDQAHVGYLATLLGASDAAKGVDARFAADFDATFDHRGLATVEVKLAADGVIDRPEVLHHPLKIGRLNVFAAYAPMTQELRLTGIDALIGGIPISGEAVMTLGKSGPDTLSIKARLGKFSSQRLAEIWPKTFSKGGRAWVKANLLGGEVTQADVTVEKASGKEVKVVGTFTARDVSVIYWDKMPKATGINGVGRIDGANLHLDVTKGASAGMWAEKVTVDFFNLGGKNERIKIDGVFSGKAPELLTLLNRPPLRYAKWLGVNPKVTQGDITARLKIAFPLIDALQLDDIDINATGVAKKVVLPGIVNGWDLSGRKMRISINKSRLTAAGDGMLLGQPVSFDGAVQFAVAQEQAHFTGQWLLTANVRRALGLGNTAIRRRLTGAAPTRFVVSAQQGQKYVIDFEADLTQTTLLAQEIGWLKPKGAAARLKARVVLIEGKPTDITNIRLTSPDLRVQGAVKFDSSGERIASVAVDQLVGVGNDLQLAYMAAASGDHIVISGKQADLRPMFDIGDGKPDASLANGATTPTSAPPIYLDVDVDRVRLSKTFWLQRMKGRMTLRDSWPTALTASAAYPGGEIRATPTAPNSQSILVTASNFGALLQATGASEAVLGGTSRIIAGKAPSGALSLAFRAKKFALKKSELADIMGDGKPSPLLGLLGAGDTVPFQRMDIVGQWHGGALSITKGRAYGNALGLTALGKIDVAQGQILLKGAISPAYGVSRALGAIPILGDILTGSKKEGLFAANYKISGPLSDPNFKVNPLSALAPGILREIFNAPFDASTTKAEPNIPDRNDP